MKEYWKKVPHTIYFASNLGRIKTKDRLSTFYSDRKQGTISRTVRGKIRKLYLNKRCRYWEVTVSNPDRKRRVPDVKKVHRMVAEAFLPNPHNLPEVNHKDGNRLNNHLENLEWCTRQQNMEHAHKTGLIKNMIPDSVVDAILIEYGRGVQKTFLAKKYQVSSASVSRIINGRYRRYQKRKQMLLLENQL